ncbi:MAG: 4Fe-4S dicluster domain-containing protein [Desulfobacterales bacterium]|jgi:molybdopterin-containing oxidoreductase family iron-sulfur binding subunit
MNRRTFLKIVGSGSIAFAAGCSDPKNNLFTLVHAPDDMVTGQPTWYASTCRECPAGCGVLAKTREGRVIKLEGNPLHPVNQGKLCMRGQAALQGVFNPDRLKTPMLKVDGKWTPIGYDDAYRLLSEKSRAAGSGRIRMVTEVVGESLGDLMTEAMSAWGAPAPFVYEPYAYESLKAANRMVFGIDGLFAYRMEASDLLVSFGADFLETWLSPVEYARKFKAMHRLNDGRKGVFFHVGSYQGLTGTNADRWVSCRPGGEVVVALGLIQIALDVGRASHLPEDLRSGLERLVAPYRRDAVLTQSGIDAESYDLLASRLLQAKRPLVLGAGNAGAGANSFETHLAANLLNLLLDPGLSLLEFQTRYRVESAGSRADMLAMTRSLPDDADLLLLNNVNPVYSLPPASGIADALASESVFVAAFASTLDETAALADLIFPVCMPLECWDEYAGRGDAMGTLQPAMGRLTSAPALGDVLLSWAQEGNLQPSGYKAHLAERLERTRRVSSPENWVRAFQSGGVFDIRPDTWEPVHAIEPGDLIQAFEGLAPIPMGNVLVAVPSIRFFDGRGANRSWLSEIPDPLVQVSWQSPLVMHTETMADAGLSDGDRVRISAGDAAVEVPAVGWDGVRPGVYLLSIGQGHSHYGRYADGQGENPFGLMTAEPSSMDGAPLFMVQDAALSAMGKSDRLAATAGSRFQYDRKIALSVPLEKAGEKPHGKHGLTMHTFPMTLPTAEGYDNTHRDFYPPHEHAGYRWAMVVDLDRCIGCEACAAACYAENNLGVVGEKRIAEGREMAWIQIQRYVEPSHPSRVTFLPMMCQHCDNAPCESVCPVYAPHHGKEGLNNQIYNRCIGTRYCSQNCPYKVRRFNWFSYTWPAPLQLQLNPDVTVRAKGVMEKCSFCIQRIKAGHNVAKNEKRPIRDGEVIPACVQTCPTDALFFGSLMDPESRVRRLVDDPRAYQVMGYLNTKPAVIYLKKVIQEV